MTYQRPYLINSEMDFDEISTLPIDDGQPTSVELEIVNTLFKENKSVFDTIIDEVKEPLIVAFLFVIFNLDYTTNLLHSLLPITNGSPILLLISKCIFIMLIYWVIKYFKFARQS